MGLTAASRILLCADEPTAAEDIRILLEQAGHEVRRHHFGASEPSDVADYDLVVLESNHDDRQALQLCRSLRARLINCFVPILFLTKDWGHADRAASLEC